MRYIGSGNSDRDGDSDGEVRWAGDGGLARGRLRWFGLAWPGRVGSGRSPELERLRAAGYTWFSFE